MEETFGSIEEGGFAHFLHSTLRERIVEHVFVGDALRRLWQCGIRDVEVLRSEFDAGGYDLVMSRGKVVRHIQFKTVLVGGRAASTKISMKLMEKPSGCVLWLVVTPDLALESFLWFGNPPGEPLPDISGLKVAKHTKADAMGVKGARSNHRVLSRRRFEVLPSLDAVLVRLFGPLS
ncbi:hypothetical protein TSH100_15095 [Azospirillum sp. TSH100]|nr:hypothetical protein TSH100_15095 [Azospirillum sp. TSH100]